MSLHRHLCTDEFGLGVRLRAVALTGSVVYWGNPKLRHFDWLLMR